MALHQNSPTFEVENRLYTLAEWQAIEKQTCKRYEYLEGRIVDWQAMAGGSPTHALISNNFGGAVFKAFTQSEAKYRQCNTYSSDLQLKLGEATRYVYPDAAIVCGAPAYDKVIPTAITNPCVVAEVISLSSQTYDMGRKFGYYAKMESLREYVLLYQNEWTVEVRSRSSKDSRWEINFFHEMDHIALLPSLELSLPVSELYRGVEFEDESTEPAPMA